MQSIVFLQASVNFSSDLGLEELGKVVADRCFGTVKFVGREECLWDEVPALRLERDVFGIEVILGGYPGTSGGYTLEVMSRDPLGGELPVEPSASKAAICEFSGYLRGLLTTIPGVST